MRLRDRVGVVVETDDKFVETPFGRSVRAMNFSSFHSALIDDPSFVLYGHDSLDARELKMISDRSHRKYLVDIWVDANAVARAYRKGEDAEGLRAALRTFHNHCAGLYLAYGDDLAPLKYECKVNEWMLHEVVAGENELGVSVDDAMRWFDQFCFDANHAVD